MRRYLVVAKQTLGGDHLAQKVRECLAGGPCTFHVVVPAMPTVGESPVAVALRGLFRTPETLAAAIVLHEVIGPPRCRRRRR